MPELWTLAVIVHMSAPTIVFFAAVLVAFVLHLKRAIPVWFASRRLEAAVRERSLHSFIGERGWQFRMFTDSKAIFSDSDSPEIRALKQEFYDRWHYALKGLPFIVGVAIGGLVLSAAVAWLGFLLGGKP